MEFIIERAGVQDAGAIAEVIQTVYAKMEHREWFVADDEPYFRKVLSSGQGMGYKATECQTGALAGVFTVFLPGESKENMGHDIGLSPQQCALTAHMDTAAVLLTYRGHHLQFQMMAEAEQDLYGLGYRYLMATVHPDNHASRNTMLRLGYQVMTTKEKYGGCLRNVMLKSLYKP